MTILGTYKGRHRKPNRRGRWLQRGAAVFAGLAALTLIALAAIGALPATTVNAAPAVMSQPAVTADLATPAHEAAACSAVYHMHHEDVLRDAGQAAEGPWESAWLHAWHTALYADPEMHTDIHHWLRTRHGWSLVQYDCYPDE